MVYIIAEMTEECCDEMAFVKRYYCKARMLKKEHPDISRKYLALAKSEMEHAYILHTLAEELYEELSDECKAKIEEMYEEKKEEYIKHYDKFNYLISKVTY